MTLYQYAVVHVPPAGAPTLVVGLSSALADSEHAVALTATRAIPPTVPASECTIVIRPFATGLGSSPPIHSSSGGFTSHICAADVLSEERSETLLDEILFTAGAVP